MTQTLDAIEKAVVNGGEKLDQFAQIAGVSSDAFAQKWKSAPVEATNCFLSAGGRKTRSYGAKAQRLFWMKWVCRA